MTQKAFYHSAAWRKLSKVFLCSKYYICERCGQPAEIAHHKKHITPNNIDNPEITLNAENLEALCIECHNKEHFSTGGVTAAGLAFDDNGELIQERSFLT